MKKSSLTLHKRIPLDPCRPHVLDLKSIIHYRYLYTFIPDPLLGKLAPYLYPSPTPLGHTKFQVQGHLTPNVFETYDTISKLLELYQLNHVGFFISKTTKHGSQWWRYASQLRLPLLNHINKILSRFVCHERVAQTEAP